MAQHGNIGKFHAVHEKWVSYMECLSQYFIVNDITDVAVEKKRKIFFSVCGAVTTAKNDQKVICSTSKTGIRLSPTPHSKIVQ